MSSRIRKNTNKERIDYIQDQKKKTRNTYINLNIYIYASYI